MSRGPQSFRQSDLTRAIKAAVKAGVRASVTVDRDGKITVIIGEGDTASELQPNEWDQLLGARHDTHQA